MRNWMLLMLSVTALPYGSAAAQQQPKGKAERELWALIQATDTSNPKTTDSVIFVSGAYPRPIIGRGQPRDSATQFAQKETEKRSEMNRKIRPQRVVVSKSGDLAYGFAYFDMEFDRPDSTGQGTEHVKFEGSQLSVWRKVGGEWKLDAVFSRPNE
jgi:ketosteroid isomerase-like protein